MIRKTGIFILALLLFSISIFCEEVDGAIPDSKQLLYEVISDIKNLPNGAGIFDVVFVEEFPFFPWGTDAETIVNLVKLQHKNTDPVGFYSEPEDNYHYYLYWTKGNMRLDLYYFDNNNKLCFIDLFFFESDFYAKELLSRIQESHGGYFQIINKHCAINKNNSLGDFAFRVEFLPENNITAVRLYNPDSNPPLIPLDFKINPSKNDVDFYDENYKNEKIQRIMEKINQLPGGWPLFSFSMKQLQLLPWGLDVNTYFSIMGFYFQTGYALPIDSKDTELPEGSIGFAVSNDYYQGNYIFLNDKLINQEFIFKDEGFYSESIHEIIRDYYGGNFEVFVNEQLGMIYLMNNSSILNNYIFYSTTSQGKHTRIGLVDPRVITWFNK